RMVLGLAFSTAPEKEDKEKSAAWVPNFTSGWITEEDWSRLLKKIPLGVEQSGTSEVPKDSEILEQMKNDNLHLVYAPVRLGGELQGLLSFLLDRAVPADFLDEVSVYAQLLGLGLHKTYLYRLVLEHSRRDGLTNLYL